MGQIALDEFAGTKTGRHRGLLDPAGDEVLRHARGRSPSMQKFLKAKTKAPEGGRH
jgi:hypothetical protein